MSDPAKVQNSTLEFYATHADRYCRDTLKVDMRRSREKFLKFVPEGGRILDAGCGSGRDSSAFRTTGYKVTAIDASPEMVRVARRRGIPARVKSFHQIDDVEAFDGIWACASLLHVPRVRIVAVLRRLKRALRRQGVLYITLKYGTGECVESDGRFFSFYTPTDFGKRLQAAGLKPIRHWVSDDKRSAKPTWVTYLVQRPTSVNVGGRDAHPASSKAHR